MSKIVAKTEQTMTTKQIAKALGTSVKVIIEQCRKVLTKQSSRKW